MIPIAIGIVLPRLNDAVGQGIKFAVADSLVLSCLLEAVRLGNRQLLVAANRACLESMSSTNIECFTKDGRQLK